MNHYKGTFNWNGEIHKLSTNALNPTQAYIKMTKVLVKKLDRSISTIRGYFKESGKDNFEIVVSNNI